MPPHSDRIKAASRNPIIGEDHPADTLHHVRGAVALIGEVHDNQVAWREAATMAHFIGSEGIGAEAHLGLALLCKCIDAALAFEIEAAREVTN
jgi:hypothetical protein